MNANIKCYPTNADIFYGDESFSIMYDFQGPFFDSENEMKDFVSEMLEPITDADNYDFICESLYTVLEKYKNY